MTTPASLLLPLLHAQDYPAAVEGALAVAAVVVAPGLVAAPVVVVVVVVCCQPLHLPCSSLISPFSHRPVPPLPLLEHSVVSFSCCCLTRLYPAV